MAEKPQSSEDFFASAVEPSQNQDFFAIKVEVPDIHTVTTIVVPEKPLDPKDQMNREFLNLREHDTATKDMPDFLESAIKPKEVAVKQDDFFAPNAESSTQ